MIDNSTFVDNQSIDAGAAYNSRGGLTHINNSTFLRNTSPLDQGIRVSANGDAKTQFEMNHTTIFAKAGGPRALFLRGIRSTGIGNTVSRSNSQFATLPRLAAKRLSLINQPK